MKLLVQTALLRTVMLAAAVVIVSTAASAQARFFGKIVDVLDGRTVVFESPSSRMTVRLQFVEIPGSDEATAKALREHLTQMSLGRDVEFQPFRMLDRVTVGRVIMNGVDVSLQLLRDGAASHEAPTESGQSPTQAFEYASNQDKARQEKRGIWARAETREGWEMLSANATGRHPVDEWNIFLRASQPNDSKSQGRGIDLGSSAAANISDADKRWPLFGTRSAAKEFIGIYSAAARQGLTASPGGRVVLVGPRSNIELEMRVVHVYRGQPNVVEDDAFILSILAESTEERFVGRNDLTILAGGQPLVIGEPRRLVRKNKTGVAELLLYKIGSATLSRIVSARTLSLRLARYGGTIDLAAQPDLKQILELSK